MSNSSKTTKDLLSTQLTDRDVIPNITSSINPQPCQALMSKFLSLPQEMKDKIYHNLFTNGDTALMRVSKEVNISAAPEFYRSASFNIKVLQSRPKLCRRASEMEEDEVHLKPSNLGRIPVNMVNNAKVYIEFSNYHEDWEELLSTVGRFVNKTKKESLEIIFQHLWFTWSPIQIEYCLRWLECAQSFNLVIITAVVPDNSPMSNCNMYPVSNPMVTRARRRKMYQVIEKTLEPALGPCTWHNGSTTGQSYLVFRPRSSLGVSTLQKNNSSDDAGAPAKEGIHDSDLWTNVASERRARSREERKEERKQKVAYYRRMLADLNEPEHPPGLSTIAAVVFAKTGIIINAV